MGFGSVDPIAESLFLIARLPPSQRGLRWGHLFFLTKESSADGIGELPEETFNGMIELRRLNLEGMRLRRLPPKLFKDLRRLKVRPFRSLAVGPVGQQPARPGRFCG